MNTKNLSRRARLLRAYRNYDDPSRDWAGEISRLPRGALEDRKLFLYYLQRGRCLYTGEEISPEDLAGGEYDIDHICPKSLTRDSSLDNLALIRRDMNRAKSDAYPLPRTLQKEMEPFWADLLSAGLMTREKYRRLMRRTPLTEKELERFAARSRRVEAENERNRKRNLRRRRARTFLTWSRRLLYTGLTLTALYAAFLLGNYLGQN